MKTTIVTLLAATLLVACGKKAEETVPAPAPVAAPAAPVASVPAATDSKPEEAKK